MPQFNYSGMDDAGQPVSGTIESASTYQASEALRAQGIRILAIESPLPRRPLFRRENPLSAEDLALFTDQLAAMAQSGLPLAPAISALAKDVESPRLRHVLKDMETAIEGGASLEDALSKHADSFPPIFISLVRAGEQTGNLPGVLAQLCTYSQRMLNLRFTMHEALAYPLLVLGLMLFMLFAFSYTVLPAFEGIFAQLTAGKRALPVPTQIVINISHLLHAPGPIGWLIILAAFLTLVLFLRIWARSSSGRRTMDSAKLGMPLLGRLYRISTAGRFCSTLSILLSNRTSAIDAIELAAAATGNQIFLDKGLHAALCVARGESISEALSATELFRQGTCWMMRLGESQNTLEQSLQRIAEAHERELDRSEKTLVLLMGPIIMIIAGLAIGGMVISLFLPIFNISSLIMP